MARKMDVEVDSFGSIMLFTLLTKQVRAWWDANVQTEPWQNLGLAVGVDHHSAEALAEALTEAGFIVG